MADDSFQERTEPASAKKIREARDRGQVAKSDEVATAAILAAALGYLTFAGPGILERMEVAARRFLPLADGSVTVSPGTIGPLLALVTGNIVVVVLPFALVLAVIGVAANVGQFGLLFTTQPLSPSLDSLNPIAGAKKLFGMQGLVEMLKSIIKFAIVFIFMFTFVQHLLPELLALTHCPLAAIPGKIGKLTLGISWRIVAALILLAVADYVYQRYAFKKGLRMTKEEVKDERKQSEGDEHTRSRIRARQLALTRNRMLAAVPKANVVITNPVHVAVALRYDPETMAAPQVVAKGARLVAERIKSIARQHGVPVLERPPLARLLYRTVRVGREVPEHLYMAVAAILASIYRTRGDRRGAAGGGAAGSAAGGGDPVTADPQLLGEVGR